MRLVLFLRTTAIHTTPLVSFGLSSEDPFQRTDKYFIPAIILSAFVYPTYG